MEHSDSEKTKGLPFNKGRCAPRHSLFYEPCSRETCSKRDHPDQPERPRWPKILHDGRHRKADDCSSKSATGKDQPVRQTSTFRKVLCRNDGYHLFRGLAICQRHASDFMTYHKATTFHAINKSVSVNDWDKLHAALLTSLHIP